MFQRFASALFGDDVEELSRPGGGKEEEEEDEDWILVNYLAEACSGSGSTVSPAEEEVEEEEDEDLVVIPSPVAGPRVRYASCTSLNSTADTDLDGGAEEEEAEDEEEASGFLRLDAGSLEESWFVTPPPCFTGHSIKPLPLEPNPLENLLIEHPSMSVYAYHDPPRISHEPIPQTLDLELSLLSSNVSLTPTPTPTASGAKKKCRCGLEGPRHRPEVAVVQRRTSLHNVCCVAAAALSARSNLLQQRTGNVTQRAKPLSRNALRRLNLRRPTKASTLNLHQPSQRHLNF